VILYFLRHGRAEAARGGDDGGRHLTDDGAAQLRRAGPLWRRLNLRPAVVITSPLPRAVETAQLFCEGVGLARPPVVDDRLLPGAGWPELAQAMAAHPEARRVLFVGHQPDLGTAVELLSGATSVRLRPGSLACVEFPGVPEAGTGEIAWLLDPDLYAPPADG
jgi:phosphohistidine phosphatase